MVGVFAATDVFLFYVFFEAILIPMYFLIGRYGGPQRQYAAVKFFLYCLFGGLIMLASVIGLYVVSAEQLGAGTFDWADAARMLRHRAGVHPDLLFLGFFLAFAIKAPLVRSTPGCPTPVRRPRSGSARCWSACWTRWARSASCATACQPVLGGFAGRVDFEQYAYRRGRLVR